MLVNGFAVAGSAFIGAGLRRRPAWLLFLISMRFLAPHFLNLTWLALIPLVLYLFRKKAWRVPVSTLLFFRSLSREHQESAWLRRLKKWLSLLLTLVIIATAVLALSRPAGEVGAESPGAVIVMVDRSASMAAVDVQGRSRLEITRQQLRDRLRTLPDQVVLSLIAFDAKPRVLLSRSRNRRECLRLLAEIQVTPMEAKPDAALAVARRIAELEPRTQIWHGGDKPFASTEGLTYAFISSALDHLQNIGITGFQIRPAPLARDRYEAFVKISAAKNNHHKITATLEVTLAGRLSQLRELELQPGSSTALILPLEGLRGQKLQLQLKADADSLGLDNAVAAQLPETRPLVVAWVAEKADPFTELALSSMIESGRIEMLKGTPQAWPLKVKPDVYVFENWLPNEWPDDRPVVALNPANSLGPLQLRRLQEPGLPHDSVRSVASDHPLLFRVNTSRLAITQTSILDPGNALEPLWMAGAEPVLAAGEIQGQRVVVTAFSPARSEQLALLPAFPLLLGNALYWCAENHEALAGLRTQSTGDLITENGLIEWTEWDGRQWLETSDEASNGLLSLQRIGLWKSAENSGISLLASSEETDLPQQDTTSPADKATPPAIVATAGISDWPALLLWLTLLFLLAENFLMHRKAVF